LGNEKGREKGGRKGRCGYGGIGLRMCYLVLEKAISKRFPKEEQPLDAASKV
jgi:hypothetical protein